MSGHFVVTTWLRKERHLSEDACNRAANPGTALCGERVYSQAVIDAVVNERINRHGANGSKPTRITDLPPCRGCQLVANALRSEQGA